MNLSTHEFRDVAKLPVADFESATTSRDNETSSLGYEGEDNFWLFEAEAMSQNAYQATLTDEQIEEFKTLGPIMELDEEDASQEWMHLLATIDTCAISSPTKFCDEDGYDVVPIRVVTPVYTVETTLEDSTIMADHHSSQESSKQKEFPNYLRDEFSDGNNISERDLEQVQALLFQVRALLMNKTDAKRVTLPMVMDRLKAETTFSKIKQPDPRPKSVLFVKRTHDHEASTSKASVFPAHKQPVASPSLSAKNNKVFAKKSAKNSVIKR